MIDKVELLKRTKSFSIRIIKMVNKFPKSIAGYELGKQILRSGCFVGANYRAALRAKSKADFSYKINIVLEEADETLFWLELLEEADIMPADKLVALKMENTELVKIFAATLKTARQSVSGKS